MHKGMGEDKADDKILVLNEIPRRHRPDPDSKKDPHYSFINV